MRRSRGINRGKASTKGEKNVLNSSISAWQKIKGLQRFFFFFFWKAYLRGEHLLVICRPLATFRLKGQAARGRKKWEGNDIRPEEKKKRSGRGIKRGRMNQLRAKKEKEKKGHQQSQMKSEEPPSLILPRFVLRILWEALKMFNALASAECARSVIKDPADDRRLCEHGWRVSHSSAVEWSVSSGWGRKERKKKRGKKSKAKAKSDKEGILFKRITRILFFFPHFDLLISPSTFDCLECLWRKRREEK